jgi:hypothetical protein
MNKNKSIYKATYGRIDEMLGIDSKEETNEYVDDLSQEDLELSADAQDIAQMAAEQYSNGNIDHLAYDLGHDPYFKDGKEVASTGEVLITNIKNSLENNEINKVDLFRKYENGESIVDNIDFMNNLKE